jgi:hypothetical protein
MLGSPFYQKLAGVVYRIGILNDTFEKCLSSSPSRKENLKKSSKTLEINRKSSRDQKQKDPLVRDNSLRQL